MRVQSKNISARQRKGFLFFPALIFYFFISASVTLGQDDPPSDLVPAPAIALSKSENEILSAETNVKKRTQLSIDSMEIRLRNSEVLNDAPKFREALSELGSYQAILEDSFKFLETNDLNNDKVQNNFKKLELILKKHTSRLELIRRGMPFKYSWHVQKLMKLVREIRAKAVEPLFGKIS